VRAIDQKHIEAHTSLAPAGIFTQDHFRRGQQPAALTGTQGVGRFVQAGPRFHFAEDDETIPFGDKVDFPGLGAHAARENGEAILRQGFAGSLFGGKPGGSVCDTGRLSFVVAPRQC